MKISILSLFFNLIVSLLATSSVAFLIDAQEQEVFFKSITYAIVVSLLIYPPLEHSLATIEKKQMESILDVVKSLFFILQFIFLICMFVFQSKAIYFGALICSLCDIGIRLSLLQQKHKEIIVSSLVLLIFFTLIFLLKKHLNIKYDLFVHLGVFYFLRGQILLYTKKITFDFSMLYFFWDVRKIKYTLSNVLNGVIGVLFVNMLYLSSPQVIANTFSLFQRILGAFIGLYGLWIFPISLKFFNEKKKMLRYFSWMLIGVGGVISILWFGYHSYEGVCFKKWCLNSGSLFSLILNISILPIVTFRALESRSNKESFRLIFNIIFLIVFSLVYLMVPYFSVESIYVMFLCNCIFNVALTIAYYKFLKESV